MLVITRKSNEGFFIGDNVEVRILDISGERAKIGIYAPREVKVVRTELLEASYHNRESASYLPIELINSLLSGVPLTINEINS